MAFGTGYLSGSETTQRESLLDTITVRSPADTPLLRMLPRFDMPNRVHEWSIDEPFSSADGVRSPGSPHENSRVEAAEYTYRTATYPTRLRCIAEINHFGLEISGSDRPATVAGMDSTYDYRAGQLFATLVNNFENLLHYGQGSPTTTGHAGGGDERRLQGLIYWAAITGLERMSGSSLNAISDPYNISIPSSFWSVFYNANGANLSRTMLSSKVLATLLRAGGRLDNNWVFLGGYKLMNLIAQFFMDPSGVPVNQRNIDASAGGGYDHISWMKTPTGHIVGFRTDRYLDMEGQTFSINNSDFTPGAPTSPGSVGAVTFQGDETLIGWEPNTVSVGFYRPPHFEQVATTGDYTRTNAIVEGSLRVKHPLCVAGIGNAIG